MRGARLLVPLAAALAACARRPVAPEGCGACTEGTACCPALQRCVPSEAVAPLGCFADGGPSVDAAPPLQDARAPEDARPSEDALRSPDAAGADAPRPSADAPPSACENGGGGLLAQYFDQAELSGPSLTRIEPSLLFDWELAGPAPAIENTTFSAIFAGQIEPEATDRYTFSVLANDGFRLWIGGELLIDWWAQHGPDQIVASRPLEAGRRYDIRIDYFRGDPFGRLDKPLLKVLWNRPGAAPGQIPQCRLFPAPAPVGPSGCSSGAGGECIAPATLPCTAPGVAPPWTVWTNPDFTGATATGQADTLSYRWDQNAVIVPTDMDLGAFSVRRQAELHPPASGAYAFYLIADSGAKLWVDSKLVADTTGIRPGTEVEGAIQLDAAHSVPLRLDYWKTGAEAYVSVRWKGPSIPKGALPKCWLGLP